jgi:hypothetical protein
MAVRVRRAGGAELSTGDGSNPAFDDARTDAGTQAEVNTIAPLVVYTDPGETVASLTVPGIPGARMSSDGVTYGETGASCDLTGIDPTGVPLFIWAYLAADSPELSIPQDGITLSEYLTAFASMTMTASASAYAVPLASAVGELSMSASCAAYAVPLVAAGASILMDAQGAAVLEPEFEQAAGAASMEMTATGSAYAVPLVVAGASMEMAAAAAAAITPVWADDFEDGTINTDLWGVSDNVAGAAIAEADGILGPASGRPVTDQYVVWGKTAIPMYSQGSLVVLTEVTNRADGTSYGTVILRDSITSIAYNSIPGKVAVGCYVYNPNEATYPGKPVLRYYNASNQAQMWDAVAGAWTTTAATAAANMPISFDDADLATWDIEFDDADRMRLSVSDGATTVTTAWVDLSGVYHDNVAVYPTFNDVTSAFAYPTNWANVAYYR